MLVVNRCPEVERCPAAGPCSPPQGTQDRGPHLMCFREGWWQSHSCKPHSCLRHIKGHRGASGPRVCWSRLGSRPLALLSSGLPQAVPLAQGIASWAWPDPASRAALPCSRSTRARPGARPACVPQAGQTRV